MDTNELDKITIHDLPDQIPLPGIYDQAVREASEYARSYFESLGIDTHAEDFYYNPRLPDLPEDVTEALDTLDIDSYNFDQRVGRIVVDPEDGKAYTVEGDKTVEYEIPLGAKKWALKNKKTKQ